MKEKNNYLDRRNFLKVTSTGVLSMSIVPDWLKSLSSEKGEKMNDIFLGDDLKLIVVPKEDIENVLKLALSKGGEYADFFYEYTMTNFIGMEEGIVKNAGKRISMGVGIRVLKGEQTGYAFTEDITIEKLKNAALVAASIADTKGKIVQVDLTDGKFKNNYSIIKDIKDVSIERKIELIKEGEKAATSFDPKIKKVNVTFSDETKKIIFANSEGNYFSDTQPMLSFYISAIAEENGKRQPGFSGGGGRIGLEYFDKKSAKDHGIKAAKQAITMLSAIDSPAGKMEVILSAADSGILLHEAIGHPLEADFNRKGSSAYSGRIGEKVASDLCTILDSGIVKNDRGSLNFDDEGVIAKENILIEKGNLVGYMHDRISAKFFKVTPSGNGRRESYKYNPIPRMTTTYMLKGTSTPEEIISSSKKAIYCKTFSGGQVDISNGDFVFVPSEAYLVENGKITTPIKNLTLIGNGPDVLTKLNMVGNDFAFSDGVWTCGKGQNAPVGVGLPTVKIKEMTVGGSKI